MKKSLIALIVAGSFALAGCSSSGGSDVNDRDIDPEWGVVPPPVQPPVDNTPDRPQPDFGDTPEWGLQPSQPPIDDTPDWGGVTPPPAQPPIDNSPERPQPDFGDTPGWGGEEGDIQVDGNGVIRYEGKEYQITGYDEMDNEFTIVDPDGVTLYARVLDDGRIAIIYNQKVYYLNGHRFTFTPDFDFGIDTTPDWGVVPPPVQPPVDSTPDRPNPDFGNTPDWGLDTGNTPDRLPPTWGGVCGSPDDGANCDPIPPKPPADIDNDWGISTDPEVSPAINNIDRIKVRDVIRSRLNG